MDWPLFVSSQAAELDFEAEGQVEMVVVWRIPLFSQ